MYYVFCVKTPENGNTPHFLVIGSEYVGSIHVLGSEPIPPIWVNRIYPQSTLRSFKEADEKSWVGYRYYLLQSSWKVFDVLVFSGW